MYHSSSQKRHWTFVSEEQLARLRADANRKFKCKAVANGKVRSPGPRAGSCATLNLGLLIKSRFAWGLEACRALAWLGQCRQGLTRQPSPRAGCGRGTRNILGEWSEPRKSAELMRDSNPALVLQDVRSNHSL